MSYQQRTPEEILIQEGENTDHVKDEFLAALVHQLRTPLSTILTWVQLLRLGKGDLQQVLARIEKSANDQSQILDDLLDLSRIQAGCAQAIYEPVDLSPVTAGLAAVFRSAVEAAGVQLVVRCEPLPEPVYVDRSMWEKIVLTLISNAFKFTFEGEIEVAMRADGTHAALTVRDTGIGISPEELPRLFERFHRIESPRSRTSEETDTGLAPVRELVQLHQGEISVKSEPAQGTVFTVRIPFGKAHLPADRIRARTSLSSMSNSAEAHVETLRQLPDKVSSTHIGSRTGTNDPETQHRATVLLVEDNADMREYVRGLLHPHYDVVSATSGKEALITLCMGPVPDLVLSDVMMPGLGGVELLAAIRANPRTQAVPVVLVSARADKEAQVEGVEAQADDYLVKPFTERELMARIRTHLTLSRMRKEFAGRMIQAQEDERRHIAQEVHDGLGQRIAAASFEIERVRKILARTRHTEAITSLQNCIADLANSVRSISHQLHPSTLEDFGLVTTLESMIDQYRRSGVHVDFLVRDLRSDIPANLSLPLYRIAQEAVRNACTHAPGSRITVTLTEEDGHFLLTIQDDGPGFAPANARAKGGIGLFIMQERAKLASCTLVVDGETGRGTRVVVRVPIL